MSLAHAILAFLVECPSSGYDLAKQFDRSVGFFWKASHQQIYRDLGKLEDKGWVSVETIFQAGRPDKKVYSVTNLGREQLIEWIAQPSEPAPIKEAILVKIFAGHLVKSHILIEELERHRQAHLHQLLTYREIEQQYFQNYQQLPMPEKLQYLTLRRGIRYETDSIVWCEEAIQLLRESEHKFDTGFQKWC